MKAPFPWFGGKSRVAHIVWQHFGDVRNYVEPFAGSLAVLLGRPSEPKIETVNDLDCWIANFWRALQADPEQLAHHANWPVNEADLHARHLWLANQVAFRERMKTDPDYFDLKIAGWWAWGISQWIGSGWCAAPGSNLNKKLGRSDGMPQRSRPRLRTTAMQPAQKRPYLSSHDGGMRVHGERKRPRLGNDLGRGLLHADVPRQLPDLGGAGGCGIHSSGLSRKGGLYEWL